MSNFAGLIHNENVKLYRKNGNRVMIGILIVLIIAAGLLMYFNTPTQSNHSNWKTQLTQQNADMKKELKHTPNGAKSYLKKEIAINQYRIDHNLQPPNGETIWSFANITSNFVSIISIFTIIAVATSIASEFGWGTIKLLLIRPVSRTSILLSKYLTTLLYAIVLLVILFVVSLIVGGILFGFSDVTQPYLQYSHGHVHEQSWTFYVLKQYGYSCVHLIMMVTFAAAISAIFRNSAISIGLSIFLLMAGNTLVTFLSHYSWVKYVLFANMDLTQYTNGTPLRSDMSLGFSVAVLAGYYVIFVLCGWLFFTKRDVAA